MTKLKVLIMYTKRQIKRKQLIKKIYNDYINSISEIQKNKRLLKFRIVDKKLNHSYCQKNYSKIDNRIISIIIQINLKDIAYLSKKGYSNKYYLNRDNLLSFTKNNKKLGLHFAILHEIKHAIDCLNYSIDNNTKNNNHEKQADIFAINHLKYKGMIK